jgi:SET domain-containing protein
MSVTIVNTMDRNATMEILTHNLSPLLCLFASRDIEKGEQILYDYGVPVPWRNSVGVRLASSDVCSDTG